MRNVIAIVLASLAACLLPAVFVAAANLSHLPTAHEAISSLFTFSAFFALAGAAHIVFLGIPIFLLLLKLHLVKWWSIAISGLLAGFLPTALIIYFFTFDATKPSADLWDDPTVVANYGVPTAAGWQFLFERSGTTAAFGLASALAFWAIWVLLMRSNYSFKRTGAGRSR